MGFSTMLATALTLASPPAAAAGIFTSTAALAGAKVLGKVLLGSAGSIGLALIGAFAGIYLGLRKQLNGAIDAAERFGLIRSAVLNALASIAFLIALVAIHRWSTGWLLPWLVGTGFMAVLFHQSLVVQPRVMRRRHALEALQDPVAAARRRRRERIECWVGAGVGRVFGMGGLIYGLVASGRL
jgi:hypothetical protein